VNEKKPFVVKTICEADENKKTAELQDVKY